MERDKLVLIAQPGDETDALLVYLAENPVYQVVCRRPDEARSGTEEEGLCLFLNPEVQLLNRIFSDPCPFSAGVLVIGTYTKELYLRFRVHRIPVLNKPLNWRLLDEALDVLLSSRAQVRRLASENQRLTKELTELKLVVRAKSILMQYLGLSEKEAHDFILRQAMDTRVPKSVVAEEILRTYDV